MMKKLLALGLIILIHSPKLIEKDPAKFRLSELLIGIRILPKEYNSIIEYNSSKRWNRTTPLDYMGNKTFNTICEELYTFFKQAPTPEEKSQCYQLLCCFLKIFFAVHMRILIQINQNTVSMIKKILDLTSYAPLTEYKKNIFVFLEFRSGQYNQIPLDWYRNINLYQSEELYQKYSDSALSGSTPPVVPSVPTIPTVPAVCAQAAVAICTLLQSSILQTVISDCIAQRGYRLLILQARN